MEALIASTELKNVKFQRFVDYPISIIEEKLAKKMSKKLKIEA